MSFSYPTGVSTGFSGLASYMAGRIATVTGSSGIAAPPSPTGNDGFLQALADGILLGGGCPSQSDAAATVSSTVSTSFSDVGGFSSWSYTAQTTRWYLLHVDFSCSPSVGPVRAYFRVVAGGVNYELNSMHMDMTTVGTALQLSCRVPVFLSAGSNTIKLQWRTNTNQLNTDTNDYRTFTIL